MKLIFVPTFLGLVAVAANAKPVAFDKFLSSAKSDFKVSLQARNQREFGEGAGLNPIEGLQLRFRQNETIEDRRYTARLKPKGFNQMKLMSALNASQGRIESLNSQKALSDSLLERYLAASAYISAFEARRLWSEVATLRTKKMAMLQRAARSSTSSALDLIEHREKLEEAEVKLGLAESDLRIATAKMKSLDSSFTEGDVSEAELVTPVEMLKVVGESKPASLAGELAKEEATRASNALNYDRAKDNRLIEFVELSYDEFNYGKQFAFRVALNVPWVSGSDPGQSEKARKLVKFEVEAREADRADTLAQTEAREALSRAADLFRSMSSLENSASEKRMRRLVSQQEPLLAVTIQEDALKRELRKLEVTSKAFESYFAYLAASGTLAQKSSTNFLARSLREIAL